MRKISDVLRLHAGGLSKRRIAVSLNIGRTAVGDYINRARRASLGWPLAEDLSDEDLERLLFPPPVAVSPDRRSLVEPETAPIACFYRFQARPDSFFFHPDHFNLVLSTSPANDSPISFAPLAERPLHFPERPRRVSIIHYSRQHLVPQPSAELLFAPRPAADSSTVPRFRSIEARATAPRLENREPTSRLPSRRKLPILKSGATPRQLPATSPPLFFPDRTPNAPASFSRPSPTILPCLRPQGLPPTASHCASHSAAPLS